MDPRWSEGGLTIQNKTKSKESPAQNGGEGIARHLKAGAASGLAVGFILAYMECLWLLSSLGSFAIGLNFCIKAVCLYGLLGSLLGFTLSAPFFLFFYKKHRASANIGALYFSIFLGAGLFAESFFYLMDIYPFGGRNKYSMRTLSLDAAAVVVSAAIAIGTYILSKKEFASLRNSKRRRVTWALVAMGFGIFSFVGLDQARRTAERSTALIEAPSPAEARPNVLFILVDSLRSDRLSGNGYPLPTSPHLDALAAEGVSCKSVLATSTWTVPTHASLFTGLYPSSHGAYSLFSTLEDSVPTLAQILTKNGYSTLCLYNNPLLSTASGLGRGFEESLGIEHDQKTSLTLVRLFKKFITRATPTEQIMAFSRKWAERSRALHRPSFIFMNLFDVHGALLPKEPYFSEFSKSVKKKDVNLSLVRKLSRRLRSRQEKLDILAKLGKEDLHYLAAIYDSRVRYEDEWIGFLIGRLKSEGLLENTLILVTADHGEFLGEHSMLGHLTEKLYDPVLRVPLILWYPGKLSPGVIEDTLSMTDIFPTLLTLIGLKEHIPPGIQGVDILADKPPAEVLIEFWDDGRKAFVRALYAHPWKLIAHPDGKLEIYDLVRDPGEQNDLFTRQPEKARELNDHLKARVQSLKPRPLKVDERKKREMMELLKSLSYIEN